MSPRTARVLVAAAVPFALAATAVPAVAAPSGDLPGWTPGVVDGVVDGVGTSAGVRSKVWFTLAQGVSEVHSPHVDAADGTSLQLVVTDGSTFTDVEATDTRHRVQLTDRRSLSYRQVNTDLDGRYRIVKTYVTDPDRATVVVKVRVVSLDGGDYDAYVLHDPHLDGPHENGRTVDGLLVATVTSRGTPVASALAARPRFTATSSGFDGESDGLTDLAADHTLDRHHRSATDGDVVQVAALRRDRDGTSTSVVALGFARGGARAAATVRASLRNDWAALRDRYQDGWHRYLDGLDDAPRSITGNHRLATRHAVELMTELMTLRAHEDKTHRGATTASLTLPAGAASRVGVAGGSPVVQVRDLYAVATAQLAAGDQAAANRSLDHLFEAQREDGSFPPSTLLDGTPAVGGLQLDAVALPIVLAQQLRRFDADTWGHVRRAADVLVAHGPATPQGGGEGEEEERGSTGTVSTGIAGLVAAADLADRRGARAARALYLATADDWHDRVEAGRLADDPDARWSVGQGTGAATPLTSMAQRVLGAAFTDAGESVDPLGVVARRYAEDRPPGPALVLTSPADGLTTAADSVEVAGTTDGSAAYVATGGRVLRLAPDADGRFSRSVPLPLGRTTITVAVVGADGGTTTLQRAVTSTDLGTPWGSVADPAGDAAVRGASDLTELAVYDADDTVNLALTLDGAPADPWGGEQVAPPRFDVYVRPGGATSSGAVPARPGTDARITAPYSFVLTADGVTDPQVRDARGRVVAGATLTAVPALHQVVVSVPTSAFAGLNLASARYVVTSVRDAGEGPRTSTPTVLDVFVPVGVDQGEVLDRAPGSPVDLPWVDLAS